MGLFYAYFRHVASDREHGYLVAFVNRETADEWWRMISTSSSPYTGVVERLSPQLYFQNKSDTLTAALFYSNAVLPDSQHLYKKMFITVLDQRDKKRSYVYKGVPMALPQVTITDHISGRWYFLRSKADPWSHWYLRINGDCLVCGDANCDAIHVSSEYRTRFCVRVRNLAVVPEDFVMIGIDEILIAAPKGYTVHINDAGDLKATQGYQGETDLFFSDLKKRFVARAEKQVNGEVWEFVETVERGVGEPWELVE